MANDLDLHLNDHSGHGASEEDDASTADSMATDNASTRGRENPNDLQATLARKESAAIRRLRVAILLLLVTVMVLASVGVYYFSKNTETAEFENEFNSQGSKLISGFQGDSFRKMQAMEALSKSLTAHELESDETWPFVTIPNSAEHFAPYLSLTNAASLLLMPIVGRRQRYDWETYSVSNQDWIDRDLAARSGGGEGSTATPASAAAADDAADDDTGTISRYIKNYVGVDTSPNDWIVWWQYAPVIPNRFFINFNRLAYDGFAEEVAPVRGGKTVISSTWTFEPGIDLQSTKDFNFNQELLQAGGQGEYQPGEPIGYIHYPVFDKHKEDGETVAILTATVWWRTYFEDILPENVNGVVCVIRNSQGQAYTYQIDGPEAIFLGTGDLHDPSYSKYGLSANYAEAFSSNNETDQTNGGYTGVPVDTEYITYSIAVYPSAVFHDTYTTNTPIFYTLVVVCVFVFTAVIFIAYDCYVERRQSIVMTSAVKTNAVVSSLFPSNVRDEIVNQAVEKTKPKDKDRIGAFMAKNVTRDPFAIDQTGNDTTSSSKPIADLFTDCSVLFADIAGFTSWSSAREPSQVFELLESVYGAFDKVASRRGVFKIETIGDSYVAVTGLPKPTTKHHLIMTKFASEIREKFNELTRKLELQLGPDTGDLRLRLGVHSGPVTAGVLRGEKARFQLFGDTVNTASRMESTGVPNKIQISQVTADLLINSSKSDWLTARDVRVEAKGKGLMQTYWVEPKLTVHGSVMSTPSQLSDVVLSGSEMTKSATVDVRTARLVEWNVDLLSRLLVKMELKRAQYPSGDKTPAKWVACSKAIDEVEEVLNLSNFEAMKAKKQKHVSHEHDSISPDIRSQLEDYVKSIAGMYRQNPFHNFAHASHVVMSVSKLMSRIIENGGNGYGITSDPLTQFASALSALIHDVDHQGVPNAQLVLEESPLAIQFDGKSVAEQQSVQLAWSLLLDSRFERLRQAIAPTQSEEERFRSLVINSVLSTDIMDKDLKKLRDNRWSKAFKEGNNNVGEGADVAAINRKATIVIEHLIQASDVAHTMQHWHIYRKWNQRLFEEMYAAYKQGRGKNPVDGWYKGEIGFFDFYVIPLAKKLADCQVFGVSSDECLNYATNNRNEWEKKGAQIVEEYVKALEESNGTN